ncbi:MAG: polysaccharide deacetylase family protein, partial [Candidatus Omnitrophota bacterium]
MALQGVFKKKYLIFAVLLAGIYLFCRANYEVPVLMYHNVGETKEKSSLNVTPETFERQMEFLKLHRYNVVPLADLLEMLKAKKKVPTKTVAITFDDGFLDNIQHAFPVLRTMNFPATIFMITRNINEKGWLSEEDLRILDESGVAIGSHTVNHAYLPDLKTDDAVFELEESKKKLEKILHHPVALFSYPAGGFNGYTRALVIDQGYAGAVTTNRGLTKHDPYALHRVKISEGNGSLFNFWIKVSGLYHLGKKRIRVDNPPARLKGDNGA